MNYKFIVFEGPDGSGKTTKLQLTADALRKQGYDVVTTREPGGTKLAETIRSLVLDPGIEIDAHTELLLYLAARADHMEKVILPAIKSGKVVLCDRFSLSTFVYQGYVGGIPLSAIEDGNRIATRGITPDIIILLDAEPEKLLARRKARNTQDKFEQKDLAFQNKLTYSPCLKAGDSAIISNRCKIP